MKQRQAQQLALARQYAAMRDACEALRLVGEDGLAVPRERGERAVRPAGGRDAAVVRVRRRRERRGVEGETEGGGEEGQQQWEEVDVDVAGAAQRQREVGRLFRIAMEKKGVFQGVPIEYARCQTDTPPRGGWDHEWTR